MPQLHFTSLNSTTSAELSTLGLPFSTETEAPVPIWKHAIIESKGNYSAEHELGGNVQERTWGLAVSPAQDMIATCITLHPSDSIATIIPSAQECIVGITALWDDGGVATPCSVDAASGVPTAESLLFSFQVHVEQIEEPADRTASLQAWMNETAKVFTATAPSPSANDVGLSENSPVILLAQLRHTLYWTREVLQARMQHLVALALKDRSSAAECQRRIIKTLVDEVLRLSQKGLSSSRLSLEIISQHKMLVAKLDEQRLAVDEPGTADLDEHCAICGQGIPFESLKWAKCLNGHQFSRCGLSFIALQKSGQSKGCRLCGTQYLDAAQVPRFQHTPETSLGQRDDLQESASVESEAKGHVDDENTNADAAEPMDSLARVLFAACDACVLCGGTFSA